MTLVLQLIIPSSNALKKGACLTQTKWMVLYTHAYMAYIRNIGNLFDISISADVKEFR